MVGDVGEVKDYVEGETAVGRENGKGRVPSEKVGE